MIDLDDKRNFPQDGRASTSYRAVSRPGKGSMR
jgi:hypothetical protein